MKAAIAVMVLMVAVGIGGRVRSAEPVAAAVPGAVEVASAELTNETLKAMLASMGYEAKVLSKGWVITVKRDDWTFFVQLGISGDGTKVGLNANLGSVENPDAVTAAQWRALLASNEDIDPSFFYYDASLKKVMLHRVLDNRGITAEILKRQIELFVGHVISTEPVWNFAK